MEGELKWVKISDNEARLTDCDGHAVGYVSRHGDDRFISTLHNGECNFSIISIMLADEEDTWSLDDTVRQAAAYMSDECSRIGENFRRLGERIPKDIGW